MKKIYAFIIMAAVIVPVLPSCKKGENDPFISFRSRKARVAGEWKVTSAKGTEAFSGSDTYTWTFDGSTQSVNSGDPAYPRTITWTFEKDGTYTHEDVSAGNPSTSEGTWDFLAGVGETKSKSRIGLKELSSTNSSGVYTRETTGYDMVFDILELRHKKMVLKSGYSFTATDGASGTVSEEYVLEPK